ncbi:MAG: hypothetical protein NVSMB17_16090 [Candidatus Dormibacteria bacterium]
MVGDLGLFAIGIILTAVITGALVFLRKSSSSQSRKDVLGISAAFVVLCGVGWLMIVGEHALG